MSECPADQGVITPEWTQGYRGVLRIKYQRQRKFPNENSAHQYLVRRTTRPPATPPLLIRKRIEEAFGWIKAVGGQRKTWFRDRDRVEWSSTFSAAAYNLVCLLRLLAVPQ